MSHIFERQLLHQLLGDKESRKIGDFVIFLTPSLDPAMEGKPVLKVLSTAAYEAYLTNPQKTWQSIKPRIQAERKRVREIQSFAPISDEELDFIED